MSSPFVAVSVQSSPVVFETKAMLVPVSSAFDCEIILTAEIDLAEIARRKFDFDVLAD
jgi:hypothetical protein